MLTFDCPSCKTSLSAGENQAGQLVRCPTCLGTLRVPVPLAARAGQEAEIVNVPNAQPQSTAAGPQAGEKLTAELTKPAPSPSRPPPMSQRPSMVPPPSMGGGAGGRRYGFNCVYCSSRLEATEHQGGTEGTCPTCGSQITIPILDRYGRLIDPRTNQVIKPDPHPVHAYAAAGERAPAIKRRPTGEQDIICPRCSSVSPISANNCKACGNPFTMEGTTVEGTGEGSGYASAALVLGIISIPAFCLVVVGPLAVILGSVSLYQMRDTGATGKGMAIAGVICGGIGTILSIMMIVK